VTSTDQALLTEAVRLALVNADAGQYPFGALVVRDGEVLATGVNTALADNDPTAHAEIAAVRAACRALDTLDLSGAVVFSSCEPCAMCHTVCVAAGIARVYYAAPKEAVPDLRYPTPAEVRQHATQLQAALRQADPITVQHMPVDGAEAPFTRFLERS
jgi:tRNA(Arg) A34 adenosine deaminase TadA